MREKKHFFRMKAAFAALLAAALAAGCENSVSDPGTDPPERGRLTVSFDFGAGNGSQTVYPASDGFTRYEVSFEVTSGGAAHDPVELSNGTATVNDLVVGTYRITGTAFTGTSPDFTAVALGTKREVVISSTDPTTASITMGPKTGTGNGTFGYAITLPGGVGNGELKLLTDGDGGAQVGNPVTLTAGQVTTGLIPAPAGYYRVHITLTGSDTGLVELVHLYGGLTSTLTKKYADEDFTQPEGVSVFDLSGLFPAPATGGTPVLSLEGTQYTGTIEWNPPVSATFAASTAYTATVTLTAKAGYTFTGVESNAFSHGEVRGTGTAGSGVLTLVFAQTDGPGTGSLKVSIGFSYGDIEVRGSDGTNRIYKGGSPSRFVLEVTGFEELTWYIDGSTAGITKNPLTLEARTYSSGTHSVTFTGKRGGIGYSQPVPFTVGTEGGDNTWEWTQYTIEELSAYQTINSIAYGEGAGFIAGSGTDWNKPAIARSANGAGRWDVTELTDLTHYDSFVGKISRLDDKFLITRGSGVKYGLVSPDNGATWTEVSIGLGTKGHTYATDKGLFLVSGQHGQAAWSDDGMATFHVLTKETTTFDNGSASQLYINAAAYGNGVFVLGGGRGHTAVSRDGKTWTGERGTANSVSERIFDGPSGFIDCMLFAKGRFIALGGMDGASSKSAYSTDGVHWTQGGDPGLGNSTDSPRMAYGGGYIVAVDNLGRASYSTDGITWTQTETGFDWTPIKDVAYGAGINGAGTGRFVIVGGEGKAAYCDIEVLDE